MIEGESLFEAAVRAAHRAFAAHLEIATGWDPCMLANRRGDGRSVTIEYDIPSPFGDHLRRRFQVTFEDISVGPGVSRAGDSPVEASA